MASGSRAGGGAKMSRQGSGSRIRKPSAAGADKASAPVVNRTRAQAAAAQARRNRATINATSSQVIGARRGLRATAGQGQRVKVRRAAVVQANIFGGADNKSVVKASFAPQKTGPAPASKASRRRAGVQQRASESTAQRLRRVSNRISGGGDRKVKGVSDRRSASNPWGATGVAKKKRSAATQRKAASYVYRLRQKAS
jgi:hypothetical protein